MQNEVLASRYNKLLYKVLGIRVPGAAPAPQLSPDIQANIELESDRPEQALLKDELLIQAQITVAAVAAQLTYGGIGNPLGSQKIVVVTLARVIPLTSTLVLIGGSAQSAPAAGVVSPIDQRAPGPVLAQRTVAVSIGGANAANQINLVQDEDQYTTGAAGLIFLNVARGAIAILPPGTFFLAQLQTVNIGAGFVFHAYERPFEPTELNQ